MILFPSYSTLSRQSLIFLNLVMSVLTIVEILPFPVYVIRGAHVLRLGKESSLEVILDIFYCVVGRCHTNMSGSVFKRYESLCLQ